MADLLSGLLVKVLERLLGALEQFTERLFSKMGSLDGAVVRFGQRALQPEVLLQFGVALLLFGAVFAVSAVLHLLLRAVTGRRRARVFLSFHHSREAEADALATALIREGVAALRLPFEAAPEHDTLLARVESEIERCDLLLCLPGASPSFVEHEVLAATAQRKPVLLVIDGQHAPRLPDTAKKGYPVFDAGLMGPGSARVLALFCAYLASDLRSTGRLYLSALQHLWACIGAVMASYVVGVAVLVQFVTPDAAGAQPAGLPMAGPTLVFAAVALLFVVLPYTLFTLRRWRLQRRLRRTIAGRRFGDDSLPGELDAELSGAALNRLLYRGELQAHHEAATGAAR